MTDEAKKVEPQLSSASRGCYDWQPGNGKRYCLTLTTVGRGSVVSWLKHADISGPSFLINSEMESSVGAFYFGDKMGVSEGDAIAILDFLVYMDAIEEYY